MPTVSTRTFNPLPFEHLEPKRFEDLARQLAYDFKPWRQLEATGRTGSDDGFDARGFEIVPGGLPVPDDEDAAADEGATDRLWLIQCKRERSIGPAKMRAHLAAIPPESRADLYGLIFVAACDFSKATRDTLRAWCAEHGIAECHIWGKAELEDMLYQPKNDNLLFAYFGISLQIRRQKTATNLRRITTIKRKLRRLIDKDEYNRLYVIVRDPDDDRFPYTNGVGLVEGQFLWRVVRVQGLGQFGLKFIAREHFAYFDRDKNIWDVATGPNLAVPDEHHNPWHARQVSEADKKQETDARHFWLSLNERNMLTAYFISEISYEDILEIDDIGSDDINLPTIFIPFWNGRIPEVSQSYPVIAKGEDFHFGVMLNGQPQNVRVFPDEFRDKEFEQRWSGDFGFAFATETYEVELTPPPWLVAMREREAQAGTVSDNPPDEPQV